MHNLGVNLRPIVNRPLRPCPYDGRRIANPPQDAILPHAPICYIGFEQLIIQGMPNLSISMPNRSAQNVS